MSKLPMNDASSDDLPQRLERVKDKSGMPWTAIAASLGVYPLTIRRWRARQARPNRRSSRALRELARDLGLDGLFGATD